MYRISSQYLNKDRRDGRGIFKNDTFQKKQNETLSSKAMEKGIHRAQGDIFCSLSHKIDHGDTGCSKKHCLDSISSPCGEMRHTKAINSSNLLRKLQAAQETPKFQDEKLKSEGLKIIEGDFMDEELYKSKGKNAAGYFLRTQSENVEQSVIYILFLFKNFSLLLSNVSRM